MRVAVAVIHDGFLLDALLGGGEINLDETVRAGIRRERGDFESICTSC